MGDAFTRDPVTGQRIGRSVLPILQACREAGPKDFHDKSVTIHARVLFDGFTAEVVTLHPPVPAQGTAAHWRAIIEYAATGKRENVRTDALRTGPRYTLTVRYPDGRGNGMDERDLEGMQDELASLARVLDALTVGETVTVKRII